MVVDNRDSTMDELKPPPKKRKQCLDSGSEDAATAAGAHGNDGGETVAAVADKPLDDDQAAAATAAEPPKAVESPSTAVDSTEAGKIVAASDQPLDDDEAAAATAVEAAGDVNLMEMPPAVDSPASENIVKDQAIPESTAPESAESSPGEKQIDDGIADTNEAPPLNATRGSDKDKNKISDDTSHDDVCTLKQSNDGKSTTTASLAAAKGGTKDETPAEIRRKKEKWFINATHMLRELDALIDRNFREVAMKRKETPPLNSESATMPNIPSIYMETPFIDNWLHPYISAPTNVKKENLQELSETINGKLRLITSKNLLAMDFLSDTSPIEAALKNYFRKELPNLEALFEAETHYNHAYAMQNQRVHSNKIDEKFISLLESDRLVGALFHLRNDLSPVLLTAEPSASAARAAAGNCNDTTMEQLANLVWLKCYDEVKNDRTIANEEARFGRAFAASQESFVKVLPAVVEYSEWLAKKYRRESRRTHYQLEGVTRYYPFLYMVIRREFHQVDKQQSVGWDWHSKVNRMSAATSMLRDLDALIDAKFRDVAMRRWENPAFRVADAIISTTPSICMATPFIASLLKPYIIAPAKMGKKMLKGYAKTINGKLQLITDKKLLVMDFLSKSSPMESALKNHFRKALPNLDGLFEAGTRVNKIDDELISLLESDKLLGALCHLRNDLSPVLLTAEPSACAARWATYKYNDINMKQLANTVWVQCYEEEGENKNYTDVEVRFGRAFAASQERFVNAIDVLRNADEKIQGQVQNINSSTGRRFSGYSDGEEV